MAECEYCYEEVSSTDECWCDPEHGLHHEECHGDDATDEADEDSHDFADAEDRQDDEMDGF